MKSQQKSNFSPKFPQANSQKNFEEKRQRKLITYLFSKSGKEVIKADLLKKYLPEEEKKTKDKVKEKTKKKHNRKDKSINESKSFDLLMNALEVEGLIRTDKKIVHIAKPFFLSGRISLSRTGDGYVKLKSGNDIYIPQKAVGNAMTGDKVEILPTCFGRKDRLEGEVLQVLSRGRQYYRMQVVELQPRFIFGRFLDMTGEAKEGVLFAKSLLEDTKKMINMGDVLIVKLKDEESQESNLYEVAFIRFESDSKEDPDLTRIMMKYDFQMEYPDDIPLLFPETVDENTVTDWNTRADLRELFAVTIDGPTAKDFDDAISLVDEGKRVRFYVHIADVSYYVKQDSALDIEAYRRATSVYLANRVVPMLPPYLSENLCSLMSNVNRLAFTVEMEADWEGNIFSAKFYKSVLNIKKRYTYDMAEEEIKANDPNNWMVKFWNLAKAIREKRMKSGRVDINLKETEFEYDENKNVKKIQTKERLNAHILIEELMLSANVKVAEFIRKKQVPTLNRIHEAMAEEKLEVLNSFLKLYGIRSQLQEASYPEIQKVLADIRGKESEKIFNYLLLRSFMQAYYSPESLGHWGLGFHDYCHFTSPIRRYPDLVVHRVLHSILLGEPAPYKQDTAVTVGVHCSEEERRAQDAERDIFKLKALRYLDSTKKTQFNAYITGFRGGFVFVELDDPMMEAVLEKDQFTNEYDLAIKNDFAFYSKKYAKDFMIGQKIQVELLRVDFEEIRVFLKLLSF